MASHPHELPASSQLSSVLSDPPSSDNEDNEILGEITVDLGSTTISPQHRQTSSTPKHSPKMPKKNTTRPTAQPTRQSTRQTKKPSRLETVSSEDELLREKRSSPGAATNSVPAKRGRADSATNSSARKPNAKPAAKRAKVTYVRGAKRWEPAFVTQNAKSPLVTGEVDLRTLLLQPAAWDILSSEDQQEILALMPSKKHILDEETPTARPNIGALVNNDTFRHDAEAYISNMSRGMHDLTWLKDAWAAHQRRIVGDFDEYYIRKIEVDWAANIPDEHRPEHLRGKQKDAPPASASEDKVSLTDAPASGKDVTENGGKSKQSCSVKDEGVTSTDSTKGRHSKRKTCHDASRAGSITPTPERRYQSTDGPRFVPILDVIEVEHAADPKGTVNGGSAGASAKRYTNGDVATMSTIDCFKHSKTESRGGRTPVGKPTLENGSAETHKSVASSPSNAPGQSITESTMDIEKEPVGASHSKVTTSGGEVAAGGKLAEEGGSADSALIEGS